jgi:uncharacterized protein with PhoU and TrkA domain
MISSSSSRTSDRTLRDGRCEGEREVPTRSIDYAIVLPSEIWAVVDVGETKLVAGDVLIQRGTNHAWANRSNAPCLVAFLLIDAVSME